MFGVAEVFARSRVSVRVKARVEGAAGHSHVGYGGGGRANEASGPVR
jgi:hypothetical protein